jgi:RNA:NAD 2'-phosphotransferase (TPT1/KptA family)
MFTKGYELWPEDWALSKVLSSIGRRGAEQAKITWSQDGWVPIDDALSYINSQRSRNRWEVYDADHVVNECAVNKKNRFEVWQEGTGEILYYRCRTGHSEAQKIDPDEMRWVRLSRDELTDMANNGQAFWHGTSKAAVGSILSNDVETCGLRPGGLTAGRRTHVFGSPYVTGDEGNQGGQRFGIESNDG